jgi:hypothetical protein
MSSNVKRNKLFISHASEDKDDFVRPLVEALSVDHDVWYDEYQLVVGMSLLQAINKGLTSCDFGIVVLSPNFFAKRWPQSELDGLFVLETISKKIILPVWHNVDEKEVAEFLPVLAGRLAVKSSSGLDRVVAEIRRSVAYFEQGKTVQGPTTGFNRLLSSLQDKKARLYSESFAMTEAGYANAASSVCQIMQLLRNKTLELADSGMREVCCGETNTDNNPWFVNMKLGLLMLRIEYFRQASNSASGSFLNISISDGTSRSGDPNVPYQILEQGTYTPFFDSVGIVHWHSEDEPETLISPETLIDVWLGKFASTHDEFQDGVQVGKATRRPYPRRW